MKRIALALVVAAVLFGAVYASAAALNVDGGVIQHGSDDYLKCTDALNVAGWGLETDDNTVWSVRFDVPKACHGKDIFVRVYSEDGTLLEKGSFVAPAASGISFAPGYPSATEIGKIEVWIEGPGA